MFIVLNFLAELTIGQIGIGLSVLAGIVVSVNTLSKPLRDTNMQVKATLEQLQKTAHEQEHKYDEQNKRLDEIIANVQATSKQVLDVNERIDEVYKNEEVILRHNLFNATSTDIRKGYRNELNIKYVEELYKRYVNHGLNGYGSYLMNEWRKLPVHIDKESIFLTTEKSAYEIQGEH